MPTPFATPGSTILSRDRLINCYKYFFVIIFNIQTETKPSKKKPRWQVEHFRKYLLIGKLFLIYLLLEGNFFDASFFSMHTIF